MSEEKDAAIQALFAAAEEEIADDGFAARIVAEIETARRRRRRFYVPAGVAAVFAALLVTLPLIDGFAALGTGLMEPLWPGLTEGGIAGVLFGPLNSSGAIAGFAFLAAYLVYRRMAA